MDLGGARLLAREAVALPAKHGSARRCPYAFFRGRDINRRFVLTSPHRTAHLGPLITMLITTQYYCTTSVVVTFCSPS
jgi:hypothetical protein